MRPNFFFHNAFLDDWTILWISQEDFIAMCDWAFGKDWKLYPKNRLSPLWNERHGKEHFIIVGTDPVDETIKKVRDAWTLSKITGK